MPPCVFFHIAFFPYIKHLGLCEDHCDLQAVQFVVKLRAINTSLCDSLSHTPLPQWLLLLAPLELVKIFAYQLSTLPPTCLLPDPSLVGRRSALPVHPFLKSFLGLLGHLASHHFAIPCLPYSTAFWFSLFSGRPKKRELENVRSS